MIKSYILFFYFNRKINIIHKALFLIIIGIIAFFYKNKKYLKVKKEHFNYINIAYAVDNDYYYITHVSMKSLMLNQKNSTFVKFYLLVHKSINKKQKKIIDKICLEHTNCNISYFKFKNEFKDINTTGIYNWTTSTFYKLLLQNLLLNENKILYLDSDTLIYKDLNQLYNYNVTNNYYVGSFEGKPPSKYGQNLSYFINGGIILINLKNLRKDNIYKKIYRFLRKNNGSLLYMDQDAINVVCNKKNGFFPWYYVSNGICSINKFKLLSKHKSKSSKYIQNLKEPYIFHFKIFTKPWYGIAKKEIICFDFIHRFYEYARKTNYYFEILDTFRVYVKNNSYFL